ncbi:hypothetical protein GEV33_012414 [Tenebrio molitor]|uniref:Uncharacterized protein n=1 Tax=Tenebrio molitor TaxID=7067 RepID=A0A8J6HAV5_TENMO|nr:hypothetical protein GEV33_012414 [Tenebrio molitor]
MFQSRITFPKSPIQHYVAIRKPLPMLRGWPSGRGIGLKGSVGGAAVAPTRSLVADKPNPSTRRALISYSNRIDWGVDFFRHMRTINLAAIRTIGVPTVPPTPFFLPPNGPALTGVPKKINQLVRGCEIHFSFTDEGMVDGPRRFIISMQTCNPSKIESRLYLKTARVDRNRWRVGTTRKGSWRRFVGRDLAGRGCYGNERCNLGDRTEGAFLKELGVVGAPAAYGSSVGVVTHGFPGSSSCERFSSRKHTLITSQLKDSSSTRMRGLVVGWTASEPRAGPEPVLVCHMTGTGPDSRFRRAAALASPGGALTKEAPARRSPQKQLGAIKRVVKFVLSHVAMRGLLRFSPQFHTGIFDVGSLAAPALTTLFEPSFTFYWKSFCRGVRVGGGGGGGEFDGRAGGRRQFRAPSRRVQVFEGAPAAYMQQRTEPRQKYLHRCPTLMLGRSIAGRIWGTINTLISIEYFPRDFSLCGGPGKLQTSDAGPVTIDHKVAPDVFDMPPLLAVAQFPQDNGGRGTERRSCIVALTLMD